jgi:hypothetical protein
MSHDASFPPATVRKSTIPHCLGRVADVVLMIRVMRTAGSRKVQLHDLNVDDIWLTEKAVNQSFVSLGVSAPTCSRTGGIPHMFSGCITQQTERLGTGQVPLYCSPPV